MSEREDRVLLAAPFALSLRNFLPTGLAGGLGEAHGLTAEFVSPFAQATFTDAHGRRYANHTVPSTPGGGGVPQPLGVSTLDAALKSVHLTGFALEYPDGSLQNLELSRRRNAQWALARTLTAAAPRGGAVRRALRAAYARWRPSRPAVAAAFDRARPRLAIVASPGHYWLDHFVLDEAARRGIPTACLVLSWDNLYSRGPMSRRPDALLVWSEEMRRQALEVHGYPADRIHVMGPLQFVYYAERPTADEIATMRARVGLAPDERYLAYVCGARTSRYDVEDVRAMRAALAGTRHGALRVVVRPHPQGERAVYAALRDEGALLDPSPDLTADDARPEAVDVGAIRHMAAFLADARFVVSSWGTTALLEACIMDTPAVQLRWMDTVAHAVPAEVTKVRDFQRYLHMRPFDATGARPYCDDPAALAGILDALEARNAEYRVRRADAVARVAAVPLGDAVARAVAAVGSLLRRRAA